MSRIARVCVCVLSFSLTPALAATQAARPPAAAAAQTARTLAYIQRTWATLTRSYCAFITTFYPLWAGLASRAQAREARQPAAVRAQGRPRHQRLCEQGAVGCAVRLGADQLTGRGGARGLRLPRRRAHALERSVVGLVVHYACRRSGPVTYAPRPALYVGLSGVDSLSDPIPQRAAALRTHLEHLFFWVDPP